MVKTLFNRFGGEISIRNAQALLTQKNASKGNEHLTFSERAAKFEGNEITLCGYTEWQARGYQVQAGEKAYKLTCPSVGKEKTSFFGGSVFASFQVKKIETEIDAPGTEIAMSAE